MDERENLKRVYILHIEDRGFVTDSSWKPFTNNPMAARFYNRRCDAANSAMWKTMYLRTKSGQKPTTTISELCLKGFLKTVETKVTYTEL